jgi:protein-S-isoprenylcysteine O-methyltransferase Ste14
VIQYLLIAAILFVASGRLDWIWTWAYLGVGVGILAVNVLVLPREVMAERGRSREGAKAWDRQLGVFIGISTLGAMVVTGLDLRFAWSPQLATTIHLVALASLALGQGLFTWAMASNKFFSCVVRIQVDRAHTVASGGPYRCVRHPGYVGMIVSLLAASVALGSLWALVPAGLTACLYVIRTALEDKALLEELDGYRDYAARVPYRLVPGVW